MRRVRHKTQTMNFGNSTAPPAVSLVQRALGVKIVHDQCAAEGHFKKPS